MVLAPVVADWRAVVRAIVAGGDDRALPVPSLDPIFVNGLAGVTRDAAARGAVALTDAQTRSLDAELRRLAKWKALLDLETHRIGLAYPAGLRPPILLKGPTVARRYGDPSFRAYTDIDVLVPVSDLERWSEIMAGLGFFTRNRWEERVSRRFSHHVQYARRFGGAGIMCEVHSCLYIERRARLLNYEALIEHTVPSEFGGFVELNDAALLLSLAVHYVHHVRSERKLIGLRDVLEIAAPEVVRDAMTLARRHELSWALERTLWEAQNVCGDARFGIAERAEWSDGALPSVKEYAKPGHANAIAIARELGFKNGAAYLASRFDPRRFASRSGRPDAGDVARWLKAMTRKLAVRK
jgi:hypothetical protein